MMYSHGEVGKSLNCGIHVLCIISNNDDVCFQDAFPMRLKGLHLVNEPLIFSAIFAIVRPFLKEKTVKRVCII